MQHHVRVNNACRELTETLAKSDCVRPEGTHKKIVSHLQQGVLTQRREVNGRNTGARATDILVTDID